MRFSIDPRRHGEPQPFVQRLIVRETRFRDSTWEPTAGIQDLYSALARDEARNRLILDDVVRAVAEGRSPILLTERTDHLEYFARHLDLVAPHILVLRGGMGAKLDRRVRGQLAAIPEHEGRVLLATGRYIGEGFDDARLDTLFLTLPVSWRGTVVQYAGRLHRPNPGKGEVRIFDYVDREVPILRRMFEKRLRGYRAMGYVEVDPLADHDGESGEHLEPDEGDVFAGFDHEQATDRDDDFD